MVDDSVTDGVEAFDESEQQYTKVVVQYARDVRDMSLWYNSNARRKAMLISIMDGIEEGRKLNNEVVTDRVYLFCMSWISGAANFLGSDSMVGYFIAFATGVAVTAIVCGGFV